MLYAHVHLTLPAWVHEAVDAAADYADDDAKMALAIRLSALNVQHGSGGAHSPLPLRCASSSAVPVVSSKAAARLVFASISLRLLTASR